MLSRRALDGGAASLRPRMDWVVGPRYGRDMAEIWPRMHWVVGSAEQCRISAIPRPYLGHISARSLGRRSSCRSTTARLMCTRLPLGSETCFVHVNACLGNLNALRRTISFR